MKQNLNPLWLLHQHRMPVLRGLRSVLILLVTGMMVAPSASFLGARPAGAAEGEDDEEEKKPPAPVKVSLTTKDGWKIQGEYYGPKPGIRSGKETVPIIAIHGEEGQGSDFSYTAAGLQTYGHATLVIDLRGHGGSKEGPDPRRFGQMKRQEFEDLVPAQLANMYLDVEAAKTHFLEMNRKGEVNIEMLCVIGAGKLGTIVSAIWAADNWSRAQAANANQGCDVKTLILLSPDQTFKTGLTSSKALLHPAITRAMFVMICVGKGDRSALSDAKRIYSRLERARPELKKVEKEADKTLIFFEADTTLQGTKLLARQLPINRMIVGFIATHLLKRSDEFGWTPRKEVWEKRNNPLR